MKQITFCAAVLAVFLMAGCSTIQPLLDRAGAGLQGVFDKYGIEVKPPPESSPEDDMG